MAEKIRTAAGEHTFDNGFKLIYRRTDQAPAIALDLWVGVGSEKFQLLPALPVSAT